MMELMGNIMGKYLVFDKSEQSRAQAVSLCSLLEERFLDSSSYCRSRVLKTFLYLCEYVCQRGEHYLIHVGWKILEMELAL